MGSKPPRSKAAKKASKTAKKLPSDIRKRFKIRRVINEVEERYWKEIREVNNGDAAINIEEEKQVDVSDERKENSLSVSQTTCSESKKGKKVTKRLLKAKQREVVNLSLT